MTIRLQDLVKRSERSAIEQADVERLTREQELVVRRFERAVRAAHEAGLIVAVDADAMAIRLIPTRLARAEDIRGQGVEIRVDDACGGYVKWGQGTPGSTTFQHD